MPRPYTINRFNMDPASKRLNDSVSIVSAMRPTAYAPTIKPIK